MDQIVVFKFDKDKDLWNLWRTVNEKSSYGYDFKKRISKKIIIICNKKELKQCKGELKKKLEKIHKNFLIKINLNSNNQSWSKIEKEYFRRLEKITKEKFLFKRINAYLTTAPRCPYNPNKNMPYFYFNFFNSLPSILQTAAHELMHIHLHNISWWQKVEKEIGNKKTHDLKEALTILLNLEFRDLLIVEDIGYPNHIKLRKFIENQWKKNKNFNLLTEKSIKWIKKNGVK